VSCEQPTEDAFIEEETQSFRKKNIQFTLNFDNGSKFKVSTSLIIIYGKLLILFSHSRTSCTMAPPRNPSSGGVKKRNTSSFYPKF
jgi:hypothetical protein